MSLNPKRFLILVSFAGLGALGCKDNEACTKARNAASDAWQGLTESAAKNKVAPNVGLDEIPADKKGAHVETWGTIEKQADMIRSSFLYEKITWNTADPAQQKASEAFNQYFAKDQYKSFELELKDANDKFKAVAAVCRD